MDDFVVGDFVVDVEEVLMKVAPLDVGDQLDTAIGVEAAAVAFDEGEDEDGDNNVSGGDVADTAYMDEFVSLGAADYELADDIALALVHEDAAEMGAASYAAADDE